MTGKVVKWLRVCFGGLLLAACQTPLPQPASFPPAVPCPAVELPTDNIGIHDQGTTGAITGVNSVCHLVANNLSVDLDIGFAAARTAGAAPEQVTYAYMVTIQQPGAQILSREVYHTHLTFPAQQASVAQHEHLHQIIPVGEGNGAPEKIMIAFTLPQR